MDTRIENIPAGVQNPLKIREDNRMFMQSSDHPGMALVSSQLTGNNFLPWSRFVKISLGAKSKLGFIDGTLMKPPINSDLFEQWQKVDYMITSWILNSISKEIVEAFLYSNSARDLWLDLCERFGESSGPLLYQLEKEIATLSQGNSSIDVYYTKIKKLWDEYSVLTPVAICTCGVGKELQDLEKNRKLMQFLMGLSDSYEHVRSQMLLMDPLPSVNKAYSMVLRVEKQRSLNNLIAEISENSALFSKAPPTGKVYNQNNYKGGHSGYQQKSGNNNWSNSAGNGAGRGQNRRTKEEKA